MVLKILVRKSTSVKPPEQTLQTGRHAQPIRASGVPTRTSSFTIALASSGSPQMSLTMSASPLKIIAYCPFSQDYQFVIHSPQEIADS